MYENGKKFKLPLFDEMRVHFQGVVAKNERHEISFWIFIDEFAFIILLCFYHRTFRAMTMSC